MAQDEEEGMGGRGRGRSVALLLLLLSFLSLLAALEVGASVQHVCIRVYAEGSC